MRLLWLHGNTQAFDVVVVVTRWQGKTAATTGPERTGAQADCRMKWDNVVHGHMVQCGVVCSLRCTSMVKCNKTDLSVETTSGKLKTAVPTGVTGGESRLEGESMTAAVTGARGDRDRKRIIRNECDGM